MIELRRVVPDGAARVLVRWTTGVSLAFVCAALGYRLHVVFPDADSPTHTTDASGPVDR